MKTLTTAQSKGLERLRALLIGPGVIPTTPHGNIKTGVNLNVLCNLREKGYISFSDVWLGGVVTPDIKIGPQQP